MEMEPNRVESVVTTEIEVNGTKINGFKINGLDEVKEEKSESTMSKLLEKNIITAACIMMLIPAVLFCDVRTVAVVASSATLLNVAISLLFSYAKDGISGLLRFVGNRFGTSRLKRQRGVVSAVVVSVVMVVMKRLFHYIRINGEYNSYSNVLMEMILGSVVYGNIFSGILGKSLALWWLPVMVVPAVAVSTLMFYNIYSPLGYDHANAGVVNRLLWDGKKWEYMFWDDKKSEYAVSSPNEYNDRVNMYFMDPVLKVFGKKPLFRGIKVTSSVMPEGYFYDDINKMIFVSEENFSKDDLTTDTPLKGLDNILTNITEGAGFISKERFVNNAMVRSLLFCMAASILVVCSRLVISYIGNSSSTEEEKGMWGRMSPSVKRLVVYAVVAFIVIVALVLVFGKLDGDLKMEIEEFAREKEKEILGSHYSDRKEFLEVVVGSIKRKMVKPELEEVLSKKPDSH